jgi:hypothetical protein
VRRIGRALIARQKIHGIEAKRLQHRIDRLWLSGSYRESKRVCERCDAKPHAAMRIIDSAATSPCTEQLARALPALIWFRLLRFENRTDDRFNSIGFEALLFDDDAILPLPRDSTARHRRDTTVANKCKTRTINTRCNRERAKASRPHH